MSNEKTDIIKKIDIDTINRYSKRYEKHGMSIETLGWGSKEQQEYRFKQLLRVIDFKNKSILDLGCGFGDLLGFLRSSGIEIKSYTGIDINNDLVSEAKKRYPNENFLSKSLIDIDESMNNADVVVMLGLLNFKQKDISNKEYASIMLEKAFRLTNVVLAVDFLSSKRFVGYPKEEFVFYYDPAYVLEEGFKLTETICLLHDYVPIPQQEMVLVLFKQ